MQNAKGANRQRKLPGRAHPQPGSLRCRFAPLALCILMVGCSQVRLVHDAPDGGVVAIPNNTNQWPTYYRNRAEQLMKRRCPEGYVIVSEQAAEDNPAARDGRKPNEDFDYEGAYVRLSTYDRKVYRISFRSADAAKNAPPPPLRPPLPPAKDENNDELPPPRQLPTEPRP
jgi:hypothetical protein